MSINKNIGAFRDIVDKSGIFSQQHNRSIQPRPFFNDGKIETNALKIAAEVKDSKGSSGIMHWSFHTWGDVDNVVGE